MQTPGNPAPRGLSRPRLAALRAGIAAVLAVVMLALTGPWAAAAEPSREQGRQKDAEELAERIEQVLEPGLGEDVAGASVAVVENDEVVLAEGYGEADIETGAPVTADRTAFQIGSTSKPVTWTAVMQGVEGEVLDLDADVGTYLEDSAVEIPDTFDEAITLRHLATHTAGFDDPPNPGAVADPDDLAPLETALAETVPDRVRAPGEAVAYSNYGTALAGHIVAQAYDTSFEQYVQQEIFGPLNMTHSTFAQPVPDEEPAGLARPHEAGAEGLAPVDRTYINWHPAGSMSSTATDMARLMRAHLADGSVEGGRVLQPQTLSAMHAVHEERHPAVAGWRFGLMEDVRVDGEAFGHGGATVHETTELVMVPEHDLGVFVSYNVRSAAAGPREVVDEVLEAYGLTDDEGSEAPQTINGADARAQRMAGEYAGSAMPEHGPGQVLGLLGRLTVEGQDGRLVTSQVVGPEVAWAEVEPYVYEQVDGPDVLAADVADGEVEALYMASQPPNDFEPVSGLARAPVAGAALGVPLAAFALSLVGWAAVGAGRVWRHRRAGEHAPENPSASTPVRAARLAAVGLSAAGVGFAVLFGTGLAVGGGDLAFVTEPLPLRLATLAPYAIAVLTVATVMGTAHTWRRRTSSLPARLHQSALAVLGVAFTVQLAALGLLGL